tara:strand:+ start:189 stop:587 length:399 start_codon:yes stop_codon:yes gene_type:complete
MNVLQNEYGRLMEKQNYQFIGNFSFDELVSDKKSWGKIKSLKIWLEDHSVIINGFIVMEKTKSYNSHFHTVFSVNTSELVTKNLVKNNLFKYWKRTGSVKIRDYNPSIGGFEMYMTKSLQYNGFNYDFWENL